MNAAARGVFFERVAATQFIETAAPNIIFLKRTFKSVLAKRKK